MKSTSSISHEEIAQHAHDIWEQSGRLEGQETEHWLRAERELRQEREQASRIRDPESASGVAAKDGGRSKDRRASESKSSRR